MQAVRDTREERSAAPPLLVVVAAAVVRDGRLLLARRPAGSHLAEHWELPGGKIEAGEAPPEALRRELLEELAAPARVGEPLAFNYHDYGSRRILLLVYGAVLEEEPRPLGCAEVGWFSPDEVRALRTPPADGPVFDRLLPGLR